MASPTAVKSASTIQPSFRLSDYRSVWIRLALLALPLAVMYFDTFWQLAGDWLDDPNNSHGVLIPPMAAYVLWGRRRALLESPAAAQRAVGLAIVLAGLVIYFIGRLGSEFFLTRGSALALAAGLVLFFLGWKHFKLVAFPLVLLAMAIPIPALLFNTVSLPLQALASLSSTELLYVCNIPVLREGNVIHMANTSLGVAEACSGLRSLMSLVALSVILAYLGGQNWVQRAILVGLAVPLALFLNIMRITGTALIANYWNVEYALGFFHTFSGWISFVVAFVLLLGAHSLVQRFLPVRRRPEEAA